MFKNIQGTKSFKNLDNLFLKGLPADHQCIFPKEEARIVWTFDDEGKIDDLRVYQICSEQRAESLHLNILQKKLKVFDTGNCMSDWHEYTLEDVLLTIFKYEIKNKDVLREIFIQLGKIEEWKERLSHINNRYWY